MAPVCVWVGGVIQEGDSGRSVWGQRVQRYDLGIYEPSMRWGGMEGDIGVFWRRRCWSIAGSPPWGPPAGGKDTAGWPGPPEGLDCCPPLPPQSSARWGQRPSGRSPGCRGSAGTQSCPDLGRRTIKVRSDYLSTWHWSITVKIVNNNT